MQGNYNKYIPLIEENLKELGDNFSKPAELYDPIEYTFSLGGKRLRPALVLMACEMFDEDFEKALPPALGIEVFHNFTLIHDDIMDRAPLRRGKETVYKKWNTNIAILSGDVMFVKAYELLSQVPDKYLRPVIEVFNKTAVEVCEGQQLDMNFEERDNVSIDEYLHMIELKTSVLLAAGLKVGAIIGGASESQSQHLYEFGKNLGIAFQLQDDLLDTYADPEKFGKQVGGDIVANKKTFLILKAMEVAEKKENKQLRQLMNHPGIDKNEKVNQVREIFDRLNISKYTKSMLGRFHKEAFHHLEQLDIKQEKKQPLYDLADMLMTREK